MHFIRVRIKMEFDKTKNRLRLLLFYIIILKKNVKRKYFKLFVIK